MTKSSNSETPRALSRSNSISSLYSLMSNENEYHNINNESNNIEQTIYKATFDILDNQKVNTKYEKLKKLNKITSKLELHNKFTRDEYEILQKLFNNWSHHRNDMKSDDTSSKIKKVINKLSSTVSVPQYDILCEEYSKLQKILYKKTSEFPEDFQKIQKLMQKNDDKNLYQNIAKITNELIINEYLGKRTEPTDNHVNIDEVIKKIKIQSQEMETLITKNIKGKKKLGQKIFNASVQLMQQKIGIA